MKLTLGQINQLFDELNGQILDPKTGERGKGVLSHKLSIRAKHILQNDLNKTLLEHVKAFDESRIEIFKGLVEEGKGEEKEGQYLIPVDYQPELIEKIMELESIEKNIEVPKINVGELYNIETEDYWPILLDKVLAKEDKKPEVSQPETPVVPLTDEK